MRLLLCGALVVFLRKAFSPTPQAQHSQFGAYDAANEMTLKFVHKVETCRVSLDLMKELRRMKQVKLCVMVRAPILRHVFISHF
ncbi:hypothetical protein CAL22_18880 [Bordetella genomosp. 12]|uniref:Uncharacterized protein n=1 Tax=Bordetella genomosp. 12 TaxID=463035 RepID=A0A261VDL1_9BORD|nr:hypothetical protein CAL22_18880 [Bordetella genomosp. 12]